MEKVRLSPSLDQEKSTLTLFGFAWRKLAVKTVQDVLVLSASIPETHKTKQNNGEDRV